MQTVFLFTMMNNGSHGRGITPTTMFSYAVAQNPDQPSLASISDLMKSKKPDLREEAVEILGELKDGDGIPYLTQLLLDENEAVRFKAADALGEIGGKRAIKGPDPKP